MRQLKIFQIDVFTRHVFRGNPAAVIPLPRGLDDSLMQTIAAENNLSETAFFVQHGERFDLRWFTPTHEVPLCGHATLAAAFVIFTTLAPTREKISFNTLSGELSVQRNGDLLTLTLPKMPPARCERPDQIRQGLNAEPCEVLSTEFDPNYYVVFEREADVRTADPNLSLFEQLHPYGVVITAPGQEVDFVSRYFAPSYGIPEDPVTGSIHTALVPYWAARLGKRHQLRARQLSRRGGELFCELNQKKVEVSGHTVKVLDGYFCF